MKLFKTCLCLVVITIGACDGEHEVMTPLELEEAMGSIDEAFAAARAEDAEDAGPGPDELDPPQEDPVAHDAIDELAASNDPSAAKWNCDGGVCCRDCGWDICCCVWNGSSWDC